MTQAGFVYEAGNEARRIALTVSVFSDRVVFRREMAEDVDAAGLRLRESGTLASLLNGEAGTQHDDVILLDCPALDGAGMAALARLDMAFARTGCQLIVATTLDALDDVFGCLDQSRAELLVNPTRADRMIALGRILACVGGSRVRELSKEDRLALLRLAEQVGQIAERLDRMGVPSPSAGHDRGGVFRFESPVAGFRGAEDEGEDRLIRAPRPALPDPRLIRRIIRQRQLRARFFDAELFADPAWDMLLDLTAARAEHLRVSVTSLCIASGVPPTTALRWISQMTEAGLLERVEDDTDRRRAFIALTDRAADAMARFFVELGREAARLV